ncbi:MAG: RcnB family protein [Sphingomonas bacterium]
MKKVISVALMAAASLLPLSAFAQDNGHRGGWDRPHGNWQHPSAPQGQAPQARPQIQQQAQPRPQFQPRPQAPQAQPQQRPQWNGGQRPQWQGQQGRPQGNWQRPGNSDGQRPQWGQRPQGEPGQNVRPGRERPDMPPVSGNARRPNWQQSMIDNAQRRNWQQGRPDNRPQDWRNNGRNDRNWNNNRPGYNGNRFADTNRGGQWNRDWRRDRRYDWSGYRYQNRQAFHLPRYYAPRGWDYGYRRFSVGMMMSQMLFAQDYWIDDPWAYRLPEVYGPYRWVRYYDDALLVDIYSGQVVDVIYDIFW